MLCAVFLITSHLGHIIIIVIIIIFGVSSECFIISFQKMVETVLLVILRLFESEGEMDAASPSGVAAAKGMRIMLVGM